MCDLGQRVRPGLCTFNGIRRNLSIDGPGPRLYFPEHLNDPVIDFLKARKRSDRELVVYRGTPYYEWILNSLKEILTYEHILKCENLQNPLFTTIYSIHSLM